MIAQLKNFISTSIHVIIAAKLDKGSDRAKKSYKRRKGTKKTQNTAIGANANWKLLLSATFHATVLLRILP